MVRLPGKALARAAGALGITVVLGAAGCRVGGQRKDTFSDNQEYLSRVFQTPLDRGEDPFADHKRVDLADVMADPHAYVDVDIRFRALFHRVENVYSHFFTEFAPESFYAFSVWPDETRLWDRQARTRDLPFVFIKKDDKSLRALLNLDPYTPIEIQGTVHSRFNDMPWIQVEYVRAAGGPRLTPRTLQNFILASEAIETGDAKTAVSETGAVLKESLPAYAQAEAHRLRAWALVQQKAYDRALEDLRMAGRVHSKLPGLADDVRAVEDLKAGRRKLPAASEDRGALITRAQTLESQLAAQTAKLDALNAEAASLRGQVAAAPQAAAEAEAKIRAAEEEKAKLAQDLEAVRGQVQAANEGAQKAAAEAEAARAEAAKTAAAGGETEALKAEMEKLKAEQAAAAQNLQAAQAQAAGANAERDDLAKRIAELTEMNKQLEQKVKDLEEEINKKGQDK